MKLLWSIGVFVAPTNGFVHLSPKALAKIHQPPSNCRSGYAQSSHTCRLSSNGDENINDRGATDEDLTNDPSVPKLSISTPQTFSSSATENDNQGLGILTAIFASGVLLFFAVSAFLPLLEVTSTAPAANSNLANSVVTRQDSVIKNYESKFDALSTAKIQQKLRNLPVFYLTNDGIIDTKIYFSFNDAKSAVNGISASVKVTTLDQILYPLILKRVIVKASSSTPAEIRQAIEASSDRQFTLSPSTSALKDAKDTGTSLKENDIPLFVVERLAFASNEGAQVPLFLEKNDAVTSYNRLRESGGNKLPADPVIRTTSLLDVLVSMERGTRQGVSQLVFYANADDVLTAAEMN